MPSRSITPVERLLQQLSIERPSTCVPCLESDLIAPPREWLHGLGYARALNPPGPNTRNGPAGVSIGCSRTAPGRSRLLLGATFSLLPPWGRSRRSLRRSCEQPDRQAFLAAAKAFESFRLPRCGPRGLPGLHPPREKTAPGLLELRNVQAKLHPQLEYAGCGAPGAGRCHEQTGRIHRTRA